MALTRPDRPAVHCGDSLLQFGYGRLRVARTARLPTRAAHCQCFTMESCRYPGTPRRLILSPPPASARLDADLSSVNC